MNRSIFHCTTGQDEHIESLWQPNMLPFIGVMLALALVMVLLIGVPAKRTVLSFVDDNSPPMCDLMPNVNLDLDFDNTLTWNGRAITDNELEEQLGTLAAGFDRDRLYLHVHHMASYATAMKIINSIQKHGLPKIGLGSDVSGLE